MVYRPRLLSVHDEAQARGEILKIGADPQGAARMAPKMIRPLVKLSCVPCKAANILKQEMLAVGGDAAVARGTVACSLPETDVILIGSLKKLRLVSQRLLDQPFGLAQLGRELAAFLRDQANPPQRLLGRSCTIALDRPRIMGILNVTPDSFSDGGRFFDRASALDRARQMVDEGADIIDIGGESTRPGARLLSVQEELDRVLPVVETLACQLKVPLSVDTNKSAVAAEVLRAGAEFINDISGLSFDSQMASVVADSGAGLFVMHTRGTPEQMQADTTYDDLMGEILGSLGQSLDMALQAGVAPEKLAVDPGVGFGKDVDGNLEILRRLSELHALGCPVLLGTSRKSFIGKILDQPEPRNRLHGSLATVVLGVSRGAQIFRVHDVAASREAALMAWAIEKQASRLTMNA